MIRIRKRRENTILFHEKVGTILCPMGFKRKGNTYVRLYGDWILQSISLISGNRVIVEGGSTLFIDMTPLYASIDILEFPYVKISDLSFFDFGMMVGYDKSYRQQIDLFSQKYIRRFDEVKDAKSLLQIKNEWWADYKSDDDEPESDEYEVYFESKYPEIAQNCRCIFDDSDMRYAAIREGRYADVVKDIKCGYYFFIAADEYDFKTGGYTKEEFEKRKERSAENFKREIEVCNLMGNGDSAEVEKFLQENIDRNTKLLKTQLKLDVKDFTKTV